VSREAAEKRLRTSAEPRISIADAAATASQRREDLHAGLREKLRRQSGMSESVMRDLLIETACSAAVEVIEGSARFRRCRASQAERDRLSMARVQLTRTLRLLGVEAKPSDALAAAPGASLADWTARQLADDAEEGE
jgi:hypothetical protein